MNSAMIILIALACLLPLYAYVGYPLLLRLLGRLRAAEPTAAPADTDDWPSISITVPVYNEESQIRDTLESLLGLDYPADRRQILVVSDGSTDGTEEIVSSFAGRGVELLRMPRRLGKTGSENAARNHLRGEIVVNTDASIRIQPNALRPLLASFRDPSIGVASGRDISVARLERSPNAGESRYVEYEMRVRALESAAGSIVGASGCFYAIRSDLHMNLVPEALSRDFAAALIARENGYRAISVTEAVCAVPRTASLRREYRRKVRTITRGMETLYFKRHLLNPFREGIFAWMLWSHKLCRWMVPWAGVVALIALAILATTESWARWPLAGVGVVGLMASIGWLWPEGRRVPQVFALPAYLAASHVAVLCAWVKALRGELNPIWEPTRRERTEARPA